MACSLSKRVRDLKGDRNESKENNVGLGQEALPLELRWEKRTRDKC